MPSINIIDMNILKDQTHLKYDGDDVVFKGFSIEFF